MKQQGPKKTGFVPPEASTGTDFPLDGYTSLILSPHPDYSGKNLKAIRKSLGMTQAELAKKARVTQATVSFIESGNEEKAGPGARASIANVLVQAEFQRSIGKYGTPDPAETIKQLKSRIAVLERDLGISKDYAKRLETSNDGLMDILGLREKKILTEDSEQQKIDALGLE